MPSQRYSNTLPSINLEVENIRKGKPRVVITQDKAFYSTVSDRLKPYKSIPSKFRGALEGVAEYVTQEMIPRTFKDEGPGWLPLARKTQIERAMQGYNPQHPILRRSGDLYNELTDRSHPKHIEVIRTGKYARIEIGGSSEKFIRNQLGDSELNIPARPMVPGTGGAPINDRDKKAIEEIIRKALVQGGKLKQ